MLNREMLMSSFFILNLIANMRCAEKKIGDSEVNKEKVPPTDCTQARYSWYYPQPCDVFLPSDEEKTIMNEIIAKMNGSRSKYFSHAQSYLLNDNPRHEDFKDLQMHWKHYQDLQKQLEKKPHYAREWFLNERWEENPFEGHKRHSVNSAGQSDECKWIDPDMVNYLKNKYSSIHSDRMNYLKNKYFSYMEAFLNTEKPSKENIGHLSQLWTCYMESYSTDLKTLLSKNRSFQREFFQYHPELICLDREMNFSMKGVQNQIEMREECIRKQQKELAGLELDVESGGTASQKASSTQFITDLQREIGTLCTNKLDVMKKHSTGRLQFFKGCLEGGINHLLVNPLIEQEEKLLQK